MTHGVAAIFLLVVTPWGLLAQTTDAVLGQPVQRTLAAGASDTLQIASNRGDFIRAVVEGRGALLRLRVFDPAGRMVFEQNRTGGNRDAMTWSSVADAGGAFRVELTSEETEGAARYTFVLAERHPAAQRDRWRAEAAAALAEGESELESGSGDAALKAMERSAQLSGQAQDAAEEAEAALQWAQAQFASGHARDAVTRFERAIDLWRGLGDAANAARALRGLGKLYGDTQQAAKATDCLNQALGMAEMAGDAAGEAEALRELGSVAGTRSEYSKAEELFDRGLKLARQAGDRRTEADLLNMLGVLAQNTGKDSEALANYESALAIRRTIGDRAGVAQSTTNLGVFHRNAGESREAIAYFEQGLEIRRQLGNKQGIANTLEALAVAEADLGNLEKSLTLSREAAQMFHASGGRRGEMFALINIGDSYSRLGDAGNALDQYGSALEIAKAVGERRGEAIALLGEGSVEAAGKKFDAAGERDAEALRVSQEAGNARETALALLALGEAKAALGDNAAALERGREALKATRQIDDRREEGRALSFLGNVLLASNPAEGVQTLQQALAIQQEIVDPDQEALTRSRLARAAESAGNLEQAREQALGALNLLESVRRNAPPEGPRISFEASTRPYYQQAAEILMRMHARDPRGGFDAQAFQVSERTRARALLDQLAAIGVEPGAKADRELAEDAERTLASIDGKATLLTKLLSSRRTADRATAVRRQLDELEARYQETRARIRRACAACSGLLDPAPLSSDEVQRQLLDGRSVLLEYMLGEEHGYLWAITKTSRQSYALPGRGEIAKLVQAMRAALTEPARAVNGETLQARRARLAKSQREFDTLSARARRILLPAQMNWSGRRILVAPDGPLYALPFHALLPRDADVMWIPSASSLAFLERNEKQRSPAPSGIALFADPSYPAGDAQLPRLRLSREEALRIAEAAEGRKRLVLGTEATRAAAEDATLGRYAVVHFAAHALADEERPELSGIALSDGVLRLADIYHLSLSARLVVLSACGTALGEAEVGEGPLSLARGFLYAGAAGVVASLWDVDDRATELFMTHFYEGLYRRGLTASRALQSAREAMRADAAWRHPYYWAGFVLIGDSPALGAVKRQGYDSSSSRRPSRLP